MDFEKKFHREVGLLKRSSQLTQPKTSVVLFHGFPDNAHVWEPVMGELDSSLQVLALNAPGTFAGRQAHFRKEAFRLEELGQLYTELIRRETRPEQELIFVAHDMGGPYAYHLLRTHFRQHPSQVKLIMMNTLPLPLFVRQLARPRQMMKSWYMGLFQLPKLEVLAKSQFHRLKRHIQKDLLARPENYPEAYDANVLNGLFFYKQLSKDTLLRGGGKPERVSNPTLFLWGKQDEFLLPPRTTLLEMFFENYQYKDLSAAHWPQLDTPALVAREIEAQLKGEV